MNLKTKIIVLLLVMIVSATLTDYGTIIEWKDAGENSLRHLFFTGLVILCGIPFLWFTIKALIGVLMEKLSKDINKR